MKKIKPLANSSRNTILIDYREKLVPNPQKSPRQLFELIKSQSGRNNQGKITTRHQGGKHKRFYRIIDFKRYEKDNVEGKVKSGDGESVPLRVGNNLPLRYIPVNTPIHNLELKPKKGGQLMRSAGTYAEIIGKEEGNDYVLIKLMSKEVRKVLATCRATIGKVSNSEANLVKLGKAGRSR